MSIPLPQGPYDIVLADPPWTMTNWREKCNGAAKSHYDCMSLKEICSLPVGDIVAPNAALALWITGPMMSEGAHVKIMDAWGFVPKTVLLTWIKTYRDGKPYCGLGFYTRSASEFCLLGIRGSMPPDSHSVRQVITSPVRKHSQKPDEQYERIEALWPNKHYIELFARQKQEGWTCWGDEV